MVDKKNPVAKAARNSSESSGPSPLTSGVTHENYSEKCQAFMQWNGNKGFLIALKDGSNQGVKYLLTAAQWGAWRAYFIDRSVSVKFMDVQAKLGNCYTFPAEWPHLFDMDSEVQRDYQVGNWFMNNYRPENTHYADAASRLATVASSRARFPRGARPEKTPASHLKTEISVDVEALIASHDAGIGERLKRSRVAPSEVEF